jgi:hypothetical protein
MSYSYPFSVSWLNTLNTDILVTLKFVRLQQSAQSYWKVDETENLLETFARLGRYTMMNGNLLTFQDNLLVPSSKGPSTLIRIIYLLYGITCYSGVQSRVTSHYYLAAFTSAQYCLWIFFLYYLYVFWPPFITKRCDMNVKLESNYELDYFVGPCIHQPTQWEPQKIKMSNPFSNDKYYTTELPTSSTNVTDLYYQTAFTSSLHAL